jgi:hypothetical protein
VIVDYFFEGFFDSSESGSTPQRHAEAQLHPLETCSWPIVRHLLVNLIE